MEDTNSSIYALKTSAGQERNVARLLARKARTIDGIGISSILVPESLKGYILVESSTKIDLRNPDLKVQHLRGVVEGSVGITFDEVKRFLKPEPIISSIQKGSIVELISGPFKGERAKVVRIDESREEVVLELIEAAVPIPVTVKIRSGWDSNSINAVEIAKVIEKAGASAICIHPRTRNQGYSGKADWNIIKEVKNNVSIPVIGNGDIKTPKDASDMLKETGCDAIMIGRGLLGNPWLIRDTINYLEGKEVSNVSEIEKVDMCIKHLNYLKELKNDKLACLEIRNHISWYFKGIQGGKELKNEIFKCSSTFEIEKLLLDFKEIIYGKKEC